MLIDGKKVAKAEVVDPNGNVVAVLEDDGAYKADGYQVNIYMDARTSPHAIVMINDIVKYCEGDDRSYVVTAADNKFFTMVPIFATKESEDLMLDYKSQRVYPNDRRVGTLTDYGLYIDYRGDLGEEDN